MKKILAALCGFLVCSTFALGEADKAKLDERIDAAHAVLHELMATPDKGVPLDIAAHATCVAVVPGFNRGASLAGGQSAQAVRPSRTKGGGWSAPVFIQLTGASFGLQAGGQSTDLVLVGVNRRSLDDLLKDKVNRGGDIAASAGPVGRDSQASTTELANAEFLTYSRSQGLFAGVDLTGDEVHQNSKDTTAYYGKDIPYQVILSGKTPTPASARHFEATVSEMFARGKVHASK